MKKVFWDNPYLTNLETMVIEVVGNRVLLEQTIAYSFSGGQESDKATINGMEVLDSMKNGRLIYYFLQEDHALQEGDAVLMEIDWDRRQKLMRLHFAAELILEIVVKKFHLEKIGAHIAQDKARIDFIHEKNIKEHFDEILVDYNEIIKQNLPIKTGYFDEESQRRYWEIEGFARVPCGGTHVKSTGEVGSIKLSRKNIGKGKERIEIYLVEQKMPTLGFGLGAKGLSLGALES